MKSRANLVGAVLVTSLHCSPGSHAFVPCPTTFPLDQQALFCSRGQKLVSAPDPSRNLLLQTSGQASSRLLSRNNGVQQLLAKSNDQDGSVLLMAGVATAVGSTTALAGKIIPFLKNFGMNERKMHRISTSIKSTTDPVGLLLLIIVGWTALPISCQIFNFLQKRQAANEARERDMATDGEKVEPTFWAKLVKAVALPSYKRRMNYRDSLSFHIANHLSQLGKLGTLIYTSDIFSIFMREIGFVKFAKNLEKTFAPTVFTIWFVWRLNIFKRYLLSKRLRRPMNDLGRGEAYDTILSLMLFVITALSLLDSFSAQWGIALKGLFAFGGVGTVVVSLASKDLASQLVNGLALQTSDKFYVGDSVKFGDGTGGKVTKIGLLYTLLQSSDETVMKIPNSQIAGQRVTNLSRVPRSQVKQILRFNYSDIDKIPKLVDDIKKAMKRDFAEELIVDGTRPFHVHWSSMEHDHLQVQCDFRFDAPPLGTAYLDRKERVFMTLAKVVKANDLEFALPSVVSRNVNFSPKFFPPDYGATGDFYGFQKERAVETAKPEQHTVPDTSS